ncbi:MAG: hypothetical protein EZS28_024035 [Streblomastix strix]|uniref:Fimbrillin family protein n=1 Tax=Streblomastix strix TaxID=222440 RepID=A0A5J4VD79_9EUKA|nr:MAG: hypothetical protein EZS28_024035 [Streblomastix strix]
MKQILAVSSVIFSLFFLNACDDEKNDAILESKVIRFQVEIPDYEPEAGTTRVDVNDLKFEHGDEIGLFVVKRDKNLEKTDNFADNAKMTYNGLTKTWVVDPPVYYSPFDKSPDVILDFYAYYPYIRDVDPTAMKIWGVSENQESRINLGKSDFMTACKLNYVIGSDDPVKLQFTHHFSLVTLEYQVKDGQPLPLVGIRSDRYTVKAFRLDDVATKSDVPLGYEKEEDDILIGMSPLKISESSGSTYAYQAIVVPLPLLDLDKKPLFYTLKNDELFSIDVKDTYIDFKGGKAYRFSVEQKINFGSSNSSDFKRRKNIMI